MSRADHYRFVLETLQDWDDYLRQESGLPGPRGNLELAQAAADLGDRARFEHFLTFTPECAPGNSPEGFLACCGVVGLGKLIAQGQEDVWLTLRKYASDPRWRIREATAMALHRIGKRDMDMLLDHLDDWSTGNWLEMRAAAAGLAEPVLLSEERHIQRCLGILDHITREVESATGGGDDLKILCKGLGYCWSVVVAALPSQGKEKMERWFSSADKNVHWIMKENLKKKRLSKMDSGWAQACLVRLEA